MNDPYENEYKDIENDLKEKNNRINELEEKKNVGHEKLSSIKNKIIKINERYDTLKKQNDIIEKNKKENLNSKTPNIDKLTSNSIIDYYKELLNNFPIFKNYIEKKERKSIEKLELKNSNNHIRDYSKGNISTIQVKYLLIEKKNNGNLNNGEPEENSNFNILINTFRINKNTTVDDIFDKACKFWSIKNKKNFILIDDSNNILNKKREVNTLLLNKSPIVTLMRKEYFKDINNLNLQGKKDENLKNNLFRDVYDTNFNKYFSSLNTFFNSELLFNRNSVKDDDEKYGDYSTKFLLNLFFLLILLIISNLLWNGQSKNIIKLNIENIIHNYDNNKKITDIDNKLEFINYLKYIISDNYQNYLRNIQWDFIGNISITQLRTSLKNCNFSDFNNFDVGRFCYKYIINNEKDLDKNQISYDSKLYGTQKSLFYGNSIKNNNFRNLHGRFNNYNGSGFLTIVNFNNKENLRSVRDLFDSIGPEYLKPNTQSVRIDFNVNIKSQGYNASIGILFENNGLGILKFSNLVVDLFILEIYYNSKTIFYFEIFMSTVCLIFVYQFFKLIALLKRNKFLYYTFSKEGITNILFLIVYIISFNIFVYFNYLGGNISIENSNLIKRDYFLDYYNYIYWVNVYILTKSILFCLILVKISFGIINTKKGQIVLLALKKMGSKFIFFFLINFGFILSFSTIFYFVFGSYESNFSSFLKSFLIIEMFTLRLSLFQDITLLDSPFLIFIFIFTYIVLVSIIGFFLTSFFIETVRIIFLETGNSIKDKSMFYSIYEKIKDLMNKRKAVKEKKKKIE